MLPRLERKAGLEEGRPVPGVVPHVTLMPDESGVHLSIPLNAPGSISSSGTSGGFR